MFEVFRAKKALYLPLYPHMQIPSPIFLAIARLIIILSFYTLLAAHTCSSNASKSTCCYYLWLIVRGYVSDATPGAGHGTIWCYYWSRLNFHCCSPPPGLSPMFCCRWRLQKHFIRTIKMEFWFVKMDWTANSVHFPYLQSNNVLRSFKIHPCNIGCCPVCGSWSTFASGKGKIHYWARGAKNYYLRKALAYWTEEWIMRMLQHQGCRKCWRSV